MSRHASGRAWFWKENRDVDVEVKVKHVELGWSGLGPLYSYQEPPELDGPVESYTRLTRYSLLSKKERAEREQLLAARVIRLPLPEEAIAAH